MAVKKKKEELSNLVKEASIERDRRYAELKPTIEEWRNSKRLSIIQSLSIGGKTPAEIAKMIGISPEELQQWRRKDKKIDEALKYSVEQARAMVDSALLVKAANGNPTAIKMWLDLNDPEKNNLDPVEEAKAESIRLDNEIKKKKLEELELNLNYSGVGEFTGIPADLIAPSFAKLHHDIRRGKYYEYVLTGGRGSTKSSFASLEIINLIEKNPNYHALITRRVGDTMRDSVYAQLKWAISELGLDNEYICRKVPLEIIKKSTEQHIYFKGADDPIKIKSIKPPFGYIAILWFEELDQFEGPEAVRNIEQSALRGGDEGFIFKSFNPPRSKINWANKYVDDIVLRSREQSGNVDFKDSKVVLNTTYLDVPEEWLGKTFIESARELKETNYEAYKNEYLGEANGHGGNVFENIVEINLTDRDVASFDNITNGVDWGWFPDPAVFIRCNYNRAKRELTLFDEIYVNKKGNEEFATLIKQHGITPNDVITCDSAEKKSIADFIDSGLKARGAIKGNNSREYTYKWLQSLRKINIDPLRCPNAYREFISCEYERDKEGNIISGYPNINDHTIDATRYATELYARRENTIKAG